MKKVIIIDNEEDIIDLLTYHLDKNNYGVLSVSDPESALHLVKVENPDVIILNSLPQFENKLQLCQQLSRLINPTHTSLICLEGNQQATSDLLMYSDICLNIPVKPAVLMNQIKQLESKKLRTSSSK